MSFPLYGLDHVGYEIALFLYALVGVGFGFALERAGFGFAPNLAAQFYGTDTRVLKVMFTAIVTACVGLVLLASAGVVDLDAVQVPPTYLWPQLAGGLLLGVGFIVSGYCPGTAVVATTSGKLDGAATLVGVGIGSVVYGFAYPAISSFADSGDMGRFRLTDLLGVSDAVLALAVLAMAAGAFLVGEAAERFFSARWKVDAPPSDPRRRNAVLGLLAAAAVAALVLSYVPRPVESQAVASEPVKKIDAKTLVRAVIERPQSVWLVDLRSPERCARQRIPGAVCLQPDDPDARFIKDLPPTRTLVLYSDGDVDKVPDSAASYRGPVKVLAGGFSAFARLFMEAPDRGLAQTDPEEYRFRSAVHAWLTGAATAPPPPRPKAVKMERPVKKGGGC